MSGHHEDIRTPLALVSFNEGFIRDGVRCCTVNLGNDSSVFDFSHVDVSGLNTSLVYIGGSGEICKDDVMGEKRTIKISPKNIREYGEIFADRR